MTAVLKTAGRAVKPGGGGRCVDGPCIHNAYSAVAPAPRETPPPPPLRERAADASATVVARTRTSTHAHTDVQAGERAGTQTRAHADTCPRAHTGMHVWVTHTHTQHACMYSEQAVKRACAHRHARSNVHMHTYARA